MESLLKFNKLKNACLFVLFLTSFGLSTARSAIIFKTLDIEGWQVNLDQELIDKNPDTAAHVQDEIKIRLLEIEHLFPAKRVEELRRVPINILLSTPNGIAYYSTGGGTIKEVPPMTGGVVFGAYSFLRYLHNVHSGLLHELSHAYHHQVLGFQNTDIGNAYNNALALHLYENVKDWAGYTHKKSYALASKAEYFALLTQAYYERSGYFPFTRDQLQNYDPQGYDVVRSLWEDRDGPQPNFNLNTSATDDSCTTLQGIKSQNTLNPAGFSVRNTTDNMLFLFWVNYKGEQKPYGEIPPHSFVSKETFSTHVWEIDKESGECLGIFQIGTLGAHIVIN